MKEIDPGQKTYLDQSRYPEINIPEFKSNIPESLLRDKDEVEKLLYNSINIQSQQLNWLVKTAKENNTQLRITNGRVNVNEQWRKKISSGWALIAVITSFLGSILAIILTIMKIMETL